MDQIALVQCSDLHFQSRFDSTGDGLFDGWRSQSVTLCRGFQAALTLARQDMKLPREVLLHVLMCGDLSCFGSNGDFAAGHAYFRGRRPLNLDRPLFELGLALPNHLLRMIPGNHDHWKGRPLPFHKRHNSDLFPTQFRTTPWWDRHLIAGDLRIDLFGIDSNSAMREQFLAGRWDTTLARGRISQGEIRQLDHDLAASLEAADQPCRIRVVMVHHSFSVPPNMVDAQQLQRDSADMLLYLARKHRIFAFLTGHVHTSDIKLLASHDQGGCWEFRSATTLQGPEQHQEENGFFIHQIFRERNSILWRLWQYVWSAGKGAFINGNGPLAELKIQ
jgi:3',5'-cyclic AMP phosphodiesterase CpdA